MTNKESKELTRESIRTALLHLMKSIPFEKISVTSIIERAGVSRAGFYRNYSSKEDVLEEITQITYEQVTTYFLEELGPKDSLERYITLFEDIKNHSSQLYYLVNSKSRHNYIFNSDSYIKQFYKQFTPEQQYYALALWYGIRSIVYQWIENGMKESPEEMAELINKLYNCDIMTQYTKEASS